MAAKIPLKSCYFTFFPRQLCYENAENVESFGQAMMQNTKKRAPEGSAVAEGMTKPGTVTAETGSVQKNVSGMHM